MTVLSGSLKTLALIGICAGAVSGCTVVATGTAAVATGDFVVDRRTASTQVGDEMVEWRTKSNANALLNVNPSSKATSYSVISYNHRTLLIGQAGNERDRAAIERAARADTSQRAVYNYIRLSPYEYTISNSNYDTWITSKVRSKLLGVAGVYPGHVKVATFNGVVYVMGLLTPAQQAAVNQAVSTVSDVRQVVTVYETFYPTRENQ